MDSTFDEFDHENHMKTAIELAREAVARGDEPFGSLLVRDDDIMMRDSNRVNTANDFRRHPELNLAYRASEVYAPDERAEMVMYTSTEPCPMCAWGIGKAGLGRVVYSVGHDEIGEFTGSGSTVGSAEVLGETTEVVGPVLNDEGRDVHLEYDW